MADYPALEIAFRDSTDPHLRDRLYAQLDDFSPVAIEDDHDKADEMAHRWRVFFRSASSRDAALAALSGDVLVETSAIDVPDGDWARRSQHSLKAIEAGGLIIAPPWDIPGPGDKAEGGRQKADLPVIIIEPSTGFGTGHHATTRLCLAALQQIDLQGKSAIDVGTGSGVLAIAARRLGASGVLAIDDDADAIAAAEENVRLNQESRIASLMALRRSGRSTVSTAT